MSKKSEIKNNNTKPGLCRKGGSWVVGKDGKSVKTEIKPAKKEAKKQTEKPVVVDNENGGK